MFSIWFYLLIDIIKFIILWPCHFKNCVNLHALLSFLFLKIKIDLSKNLTKKFEENKLKTRGKMSGLGKHFKERNGIYDSQKVVLLGFQFEILTKQSCVTVWERVLNWGMKKGASCGGGRSNFILWLTTLRRYTIHKKSIHMQIYLFTLCI